MNATLDFILRHPYPVLFGAVFAEQLGLPLPAAPFLLGAGALAGADKLNVAVALLVPVAASVLADLVWYEAGRRRGGQRTPSPGVWGATSPSPARDGAGLTRGPCGRPR